MNLRGYFVACYTPFQSDGAIDEAALRRNVRATLAKPGVGGLSLHSIHQEFWTLTLDERRRITDAVLEEVAGRTPVVVGISDNAVRNAIALGRHAKAAGATAAMLWPPTYGPRTADGVRTYYEEVAAGIDLPFFCYSTTLSELGYHLDAPQVERLLAIPHLAGVQVTTSDTALFDDMVARCPHQLAVTTSLEDSLLYLHRHYPSRAPAFTLGSSRPLFCQSAAQPHCGRFMEALRAGRLDEAEAHQKRIAEIAQKLQTRYFAQGFHHVALFKRLAGRMGLETHGLRAPLAEPDPRELSECLEVLRQSRLLPA